MSSRRTPEADFPSIGIGGSHLHSEPTPRAPDRIERARVALIRAILITTCVGSGACAIIFPFFYDRWAEALFTNATIALATLPLLHWLRKGVHVRRIGRATAGLALGAVIVSIMNSGGIRSPAILSFPAALLVAGFAASARATFFAMLAMLAALGAVVVGEEQGWLVGVTRPYSPLELCMSFAASLVATAMVIYVSLGALNEALEGAETSERELRDLIDQSPDGIVSLALDGRVTSANPATYALVHLRETTLVGTLFWEIPSLTKECRAPLAAWIENAREGDSADLGATFDAGDAGDAGLVHTRARLRRARHDERSPGLLVTLRDETARVRAESERAELQNVVARTQKMQVVGQLAGGVAHDFNNYLTVIRTCSDLLRKKLPPDSKSLEPLLDAISDATGRSSDLTRQLLAFSRKQVMQSRLTDLSALVRATEPMARRTLDPRIELSVVVEDAPATATADVDPSQLEVALLNLVVNARDAMPAGGKLTIEIASLDLTAEFVARHPGAPAGRAVMVAVHDTGVGMDAETLARACEPFFTTKGSLGTGLGLSSVYGIVEQSRGTLVLESRPGEGTSVRMFLPFAAGTAEPLAARDETPLRGGTETILLVEDLPLLREVTTAMLRSHGYRVIAFETAEDALAEFGARDFAYDLLLTDLLLPGLDGIALAMKLKVHRPSTPVLLVSGYTDARRGELEEGEVALPLLHKPYASRELLETLRTLLDPRSSDPA